jgi:hypothetical protein
VPQSATQSPKSVKGLKMQGMQIPNNPCNQKRGKKEIQLSFQRFLQEILEGYGHKTYSEVVENAIALATL